MPELPEVETVVRSLREPLVGCRLGEAWTSGKSLRRPVDAGALRRVAGARVESVERRGKYLVLRLSEGGALVAHLGMTGRLLISARSEPRPTHTHVVFPLDEGALELRYVDARRFGWLVAHSADELPHAEELAALGPEPLSRDFTVEGLTGALGESRRAIKDFLLDQSRLAGLGNIYASEVLHRAAIAPRRRADRLGPGRAARLHAAIVAVLEEAIARRGTTLSDYVDAFGQRGDNQNHLSVYGREGLGCRRCGAQVKRLVQGARATFYCPGCQR